MKLFKTLILKYIRSLDRPEVFEYTQEVEKIFREKHTDLNVKRMREASGGMKTKSLLVTFLYILLRDEVPAGKIERIMLQLSNAHDYSFAEHEETQLTNGWIGHYAEDIATRLLDNRKTGDTTK